MTARPLCFAVVLMATISADAQLTRGYISGMVTDSAGGSISGVKVVATHQATNLAREMTTNDSGLYRFAGLEPGVYSVEFSDPRFQTARISSIPVDSGGEPVVNFKLVLLQQATSVSVTDAPAGVELAKASAAIDRTLGPAVLETVPLSGTLSREINPLMALGPATVRVTARPEFNYVAAGQRQGRTEFLADGLDNRTTLDFALWRPIPEQAAEFQVKTNAYSAEFGRTSGVVVSVVSRSGGNQLHGAIWDYYGANWMSAQILANKRAGLGLPRSQEHHAGASAGGPIRRNRTFFFGLFQGRPSSSGSSVALSSPVTIPTAAGFEELSRVPLGPGQSAESRQAALSTLGFLREVYPLIGSYQDVRPQNINGALVETGTALIPAPNRVLVLTSLARLDHHLTARDNLAFRWQIHHFDEDLAQGGRASLSNAAFGPLFSARSVGSTWSTMASHTRIIGPSAVNEFRFGASANPFHSKPARLAGPYVITPGFVYGAIPATPFDSDSLNLQWQDVLTVQRGRHSLKAGADLLRVYSTNLNVNSTRGIWIFPSLANLLNNQAVRLLYQRETAATEVEQLQQAYFFQDDVRVKSNLTMNFGLRYQTAGTPLSVYGTDAPELLSAGVPRPIRRDTNDWAPRFGLAWSPSERTVVRGGFGASYEQTPGPPVTVAGFVTYPRQIQFSLFPPASFGIFPNLPAGGPGVPPLDPAAYDFLHPTPDWNNAATHFYSFSVQRQLGRYHFTEAGYIGSRAYHLWRFNERNAFSGGRRVNPAWAARRVIETSGSSNYNAAFVRFDRRLGAGLLFGLNYTWSATLDDGEGPPQDTRNYRREHGRADIDRPHRVSAHFVWTAPELARADRILKGVLGGWQIAGYAEWQSGEPFTVTTGADGNGDVVFNPTFPNKYPDRPDYNPSGRLSLDPATNNWRSFRTPINGTGVFVTPLSPQGLPLDGSMPFGGNLGRNTFRGPAYANTHLSLLKEFVLSKRARLELRASWTNFLNHRNFGAPVAVMNSPAFGTNQSNPDARVTILALKVRF